MCCGNQRKIGDESGQVLVFATIVMVVLIGITGFALDVGRAYLVQRQLQASADASALAGAFELPDSANAEAASDTYGAGAGGRNPAKATDNATMTVEPRCVPSLPGCEGGVGSNAITVTARSDVPTVFARVLGIDSLSVSAKATACSPCKANQADVMIVLDRTGSMCQPDCTNFNLAREGIRTFLRQMDPRYVKVGLAVLPPATSVAARCAAPPGNGDFTDNYNLASPAYTIVPLASNFATSLGTLNNSSDFLTTLGCVRASGRTAYANAIDAAQAAVTDNSPGRGRAGAQKAIIFLSDGAANYGPTTYPTTNPYRYQPCHQGVARAGVAKTAGTSVYSIGYALSQTTPPATPVYEACRWNRPGADMTLESPAMDSFQALQAIASSPTDSFYNVRDEINPVVQQQRLNAVFSSIAADVIRTAQLIDNSLS